MQLILTNYIYFQHSVTRPSNSYTAVVTARVGDGQWISDPAITTVTVEFTNLSPIVYIKGQVRIYQWMNECMNEWINEWMNVWMNELMNEWMYEWMN